MRRASLGGKVSYKAAHIVNRFYLRQDQKLFSHLKEIGLLKPEELDSYLDEHYSYLSQEDVYIIEGLIADRESARELQEMIKNCLSEEEIMVLKAKYFEDLPYKIISEQTNRPVGTLRSLVSRATEKLRDGYRLKYPEAFSE